jgi:hypothetical protein
MDGRLEEDWEGELERWLEPFLAGLRRKAQRRWAPFYLAGSASTITSGYKGGSVVLAGSPLLRSAPLRTAEPRIWPFGAACGARQMQAEKA